MIISEYFKRKRPIPRRIVLELGVLSQKHTTDKCINMDFLRYVKDGLLRDINALWVLREGNILIGALGIDYKFDLALDFRGKWDDLQTNYGSYGLADLVLASLMFKDHEKGIDVNRSAFIEYFAIDSKYRHRNLDEALYRRAVQHLKQEKKTHLYFFTTAVSRNTQAFLDVHGFREKEVPLTVKFIKRVQGFKEFHLFEKELEPVGGRRRMRRGADRALPSMFKRLASG